MISLFRNFAKSKWATGLLVLVGLALLVGGGRQMDVLGALGPKHVISAGDRSVDGPRFKAEFDRAREQAAEQAGQALSMEDAVKAGLHLRYLQQQTQLMGFLDWAGKYGVHPGRDLVVKQIRDIRAFFNPVTGQFDQATYEQLLAQQNLTPTDVEQDIRDRYVTQHVGSALIAGVRLPRIYGALAASGRLATRDGRWFTVTQAMAGTTPAPTDAQLRAFMTENAERLRQPELRRVSVIVFDDARGAAQAPIAENRIVERFNFRKDALSQPETRSFITVTAATRLAAEKIAAALRAGASPADAGRANGGVEPATFDAKPRSAVSDPAVAAAVFGAQPGQIVGPVQGQLGFTVAKVSAVTPGRPATLENAREAIVQELRQDDVKRQIYSRVELYQKARDAGKSVEDAVRESGARVVEGIPPFTRDGKLPNGQPLNAPPQIIQQAYALSKGAASDVVDAGQGQYFVVRLDDLRPAALPTLEEVRPVLTEAWISRENGRLLLARSEAVAARVRGGEDIAAVARSVGATLQTGQSVQLSQDSQTRLGAGVLRGLFSQKPGDVFTSPNEGNSMVVGRIDAVHAATPVLAAPLAEQARGAFADATGNALVEAAVAGAARQVKASSNTEEALRALGVTAPANAPADIPAAPTGG